MVRIGWAQSKMGGKNGMVTFDGMQLSTPPMAFVIFVFFCSSHFFMICFIFGSFRLWAIVKSYVHEAVCTAHTHTNIQTKHKHTTERQEIHNEFDCGVDCDER